MSVTFYGSINCSHHWNHYIYPITISIHYAGYVVLIKSVLYTLLLRLHLTFKDSAFELTSSQYKILAILAVVDIIFSFVSLIMGIIITFTESPLNYFGTFDYMQMGMLITSTILYLTITIYGMYLFSSKLLILIELQATSLRNVVDINTVALNDTQQELLQRTSRYIILISIAMITSLFTWILWIFWIDMPGIRIINNIDCTTNVICLYLQYPFATKYYDRYCKCTNKCLNMILSRQTTKHLEKKYRNSIQVQHVQVKSKTISNETEEMIALNESTTDEKLHGINTNDNVEKSTGNET